MVGRDTVHPGREGVVVGGSDKQEPEKGGDALSRLSISYSVWEPGLCDGALTSMVNLPSVKALWKCP